MFSKIEVNGEGACDLYRFLKSSQGDGADISWNFEKFLVDGQGQVIARFAPPTPPAHSAGDLAPPLGGRSRGPRGAIPRGPRGSSRSGRAASAVDHVEENLATEGAVR